MSYLARQRRRRRHRGGSGRIFALGFGVTLVTIVLGALAAVGYVVGIAASAPSIESLKAVDKGSTSQVFAANGARLGFIQSDELRTPILSSEMPQTLKDATVAIEDRRFFKHKGVDIEGIVRAAFKNLRSGKTVQGGSTITMQLVRNLYISGERRTFKRKVREAKLAEELESRHPGRGGKNWILTKYLNSIPYGTLGGQTAVGVQAAARMFFNKPVSQLTLPQSALLAGLPQETTVNNPFLNPRGAKRRRNEVLRKMAEQRYITHETAVRAMAEPLGVEQGRYYRQKRESYFFDYVQQELIKEYGVNQVRLGGLKIHTTIDLRLQSAARRAMANQLNLPGDPASAIVSIDPRTGYIKAMASSGRYDESKFNLAAQGRRQPGSTFKTMVLMAALRRGVDPRSTTYVSKPLKFRDPAWGPIEVQTYSNSYMGRTNIVEATLKSDNTVYQQLDLDLGPDYVRKTAYDMGITTKLDAYPAEGLGGLTIGVSPLEMTNAYATIASGGWRSKPIAITRVVFPDGDVDDLSKPKRHKAFDDAVAYEATKILQMNIQRGTGTRASIGCPAAGKTGTTDDHTDAWFSGYTPHLSTTVWVGYPKAKVPMTSVHGISVAGGTFPAAIWHDYMLVAKGTDCSDFSKPNSAFQAVPFFGKYATTGRRSDYRYDPTQTTPTTGQDGSGYDPNLYESPPQQAPETGGEAPTPPPAATPEETGGAEPGNGQGKGRGQGNGQGNGNDDGGDG